MFHGKPNLVIYSDASKKGWGAFNEIEHIKKAGGGGGGSSRDGIS